MNELVVRRRKLAVQAMVILLTIAGLSTPTARTVLAAGLVGFVDVTKRILRFPCCLIDHKHCLSLDRFDPTCPQCM
jgi:hypothetical protein